MIVEIDVKEKWEIGDELDKTWGCVTFSGGPLDIKFRFEGTWNPGHPTNPQLRAAVEKQWEKLRPLGEEEFRAKLGTRYRFRMNGDDVEFSAAGNPPGSGFVAIDFAGEGDLRTAAEAFKSRELAKREAEWKVGWDSFQRCALVSNNPENILFGYMGGAWDCGFHQRVPESVRRRAEELWKRNRPLKANEWRGVVNKEEVTLAFRWDRNEAIASYVPTRTNDCVAWRGEEKLIFANGYQAAHTALGAWATRPENLPHHIAIVDGKPYVMQEDEARSLDGAVQTISEWWSISDLDTYTFAPGQRERVEKWRASQGKERLYPDPKKHSWPDLEVAINGRIIKPAYVGVDFGKSTDESCFTFLHNPKPLGENELERLNGTRELVEFVSTDEDMPSVGSAEWLPWSKYTAINDYFIPGSVDRAKRIFARLYKFSDDEGVDATTGKLRTMAINEARHPETGEIVRLTDWSDKWSERRFGCKENHVGETEDASRYFKAKWGPYLARCIAYRDHVLALEKQLAELK